MIRASLRDQLSARNTIRPPFWMRLSHTGTAPSLGCNITLVQSIQNLEGQSNVNLLWEADFSLVLTGIRHNLKYRTSLAGSKDDLDPDLLMTCGPIRPYIEHDGVRIYPGIIVMANAFDGKEFNEKFAIKNFGKHMVNVKVVAPKSTNFVVKPIVSVGIDLAPGMQLEKSIKHLYKSQTSLSQVTFPIFINNFMIHYRIIITIPQPIITASTTEIDLGTIDIGKVYKNTITLTNNGHQQGSFRIDILTKSDLIININPKKGSIDAMKNQLLDLEIIGNKPGYFNREFWIKTEPKLLRITFSVTVIIPNLVTIHPLTDYNITVIEFSKCYVGSSSLKTLVINNQSSVASMFCGLAEIENELIDVRDAYKKDLNYKYFSIVSQSGRLPPNGSSIIQIKFAPIKTKIAKKCALCLIRIIKVPFRDFNETDSDLFYKETQPVLKYPSKETLKDDHLEAEISEYKHSEEIIPNKFIRVCFYGEIEVAKVYIRPESVHIRGDIGETYQHELNLRNKSIYLPIYYEYIKSPYIEVEPRFGRIEPTESVEILMKIRPNELGEQKIKVVFKLRYPGEVTGQFDEVGDSSLEVNITGVIVKNKLTNKYVTGLTPFVVNEVGYVYNDITFGDKSECPKLSTIVKEASKNVDKTDLLALPNDRQKSLKPWRNTTRCATLFSNLPRTITPDDQYNLTDHEKLQKDKNETYYINFIRSYRRITPFNIQNEDYDLTNKNHLLLKHMKCLQTCFSIEQETKISAFIPLTAEQLNKIIFLPDMVNLDKIAANTQTTDVIQIENKNDFDICLLIKSGKPCLTVLKNYIIIKAKTFEMFKFSLIVREIGHFSGTIAILVNSCHIFELLVTAQIIPPSLSCEEGDITLSPDRNLYFIKVKNPVDVFVEFNWNLSDTTRFNIYPKQGMFPPKKDMFFVLRYKPKVEQGNNVEIILVAQNEKKSFLVKHEEKNVEFKFNTNHVDFGKMPLNVLMVEELFLKNLNDNSLSFVVDNPKQIYGVQIKPSKGVINANSMKLFHINAKFREVMDFTTHFNFIFDQEPTSHSVKVTGSVVYPNIKIVPEKIQIPKVVPEAMVRYEFSLQNKSVCKAKVKFLTETIKEINVADITGNLIKLISLLPGETQYLFLEFTPKEAVAFSVYLPLMINHIFGPSEYGNKDSLDPKTFLNHREGLERVKPTKIPSKLPILNVNFAAGDHFVKFSRLRFEFCQNLSLEPQSFTIRNVSNIKVRIIINMEALDIPFSMKYIDGPIPRDYDNTKLIRLQPKEEITYQISFKSDSYGTYTINLPIYLKEYYNNCIFNSLKLYGEYFEPKISPQTKILYFDVILPKIVAEQKLIITLEWHKLDCQIDVDCPIPELTIKMYDEDQDSHNERVVTILFHPHKALIINQDIKFFCTCGGECDVKIRAVSGNSIMTSYKSYFKLTENNSNMNLTILSEEFVTLTSQVLEGKAEQFPNFPMLDTKDAIEQLVIKTLTIIESWLYTQGFFCKDHYKLPFNISIYSPFKDDEDDRKNKKNKKKEKPQKKLLPVQQLLVNLTDQSVLQYVKSDFEAIDGDFSSETIACYSIYKNLIKFLLSNEMLSTHIHPELLLSYDQYVYFKENINDADADDTEILMSENFYSLSTQAWFDLVMQIFKIFVLVKVNLKVQRKEVNFYQDDTFFEYISDSILSMNEGSKAEKILLLWMEFIYNENKNKLSSKLKSRTIRNFIHDLKDGIVIAVILITYCPYILLTLTNIIIDNNSDETYINNACVLIQIFETLKFSLDVDPLAIVYPNPCEMVILISYLYNILPYFYPCGLLEIEAKLGGTNFKELEVKNPGDVYICYRGIFIPQSELFEVEPVSLVVPPKQTKTVKIIFKSKNVLKTTVTLILSGETPKFKYAKSMTYTLTGIPTFDTDNIIKIKVPIYTPVHKKLSITSPYEDYTCKMYVAPILPPNSMSDFISFKEWDNLKIPRQVSSEQNELYFDIEGRSKLALDICFILPGKRDFLIFFIHELGHFCYNVKISVTSKELNDQIYVDIPKNFDGKCVCKNNNIRQTCPKSLEIQIPYKNQLLWNSIMTLIKTSRPQDENFWRKYLQKPIGIYILKMIMNSTPFWKFEGFKELFGENIDYSTSFSKALNGPEKITIPDVKVDNEKLTMLVHFNGKKSPVKEKITLLASHGNETREYILFFFDTNK